MEPITLIVAALAAGAAAGLQNTASDAVKDAYAALKGAILQRFGGKPEVSVALEKAETKPDVWTEPLKDALEEAGADRAPEIIRAAQELMKLMEPSATQAGKYNVHISGNVKGFAVGDNQDVQMTFHADT